MRIRFITRAAPPEALLASLRGAGHAVEITDDAALTTLPADTHALIDASALASVPADAAARPHIAALVRGTDGLPRDLVPRLRRIVVTSHAAAARLAEGYGADPASLRVVVPGVDPAPRNDRPEKGPEDTGCVLLSPGGPAEDEALLLHAVARLFDLEWSLVLRAPARTETTALAERLGIAARVRHADTPATPWPHTGLLVLTTPWHDEPPAILGDALRRGVPVVATVAGPAAADVPALAGLACPPGDGVQLSRALRRLIFDPTLRRAYADAAAAAGAALPDWPTQAARLIDALQ